MKLALFALLSTLSFPVMAAGFTLGSIVMYILVLIGIAIVFGILYYLVGAAPLIPPLGKQLIQYFIIFVGGVIAIGIILGLIGYPLHPAFKIG